MATNKIPRIKEKLNIVDENNNIIGEDTRYNIHKKGLLHREVNVWIYNLKGEVLFQKRALSKDTFPGLLDASAGGHVELNKTYEETAIKELKEETGILTNISKLKPIKRIHNKSYDQSTGMINNTLKKVYAYEYNGNIKNLKLEKGKSLGFEFWPLEKIFNISEKDKQKFIPFIISGRYIEIFRKIRELIKKEKIKRKE